MNLLLDTNALLWWLQDSPHLGRRARSKISSQSSTVWVSSASAWEMAIKVATGRLRFSQPLTRFLPEAIAREGFVVISVSLDHALVAGELPRHHADPFDRLLIAQAQVEGMTIVTSDVLFESYRVSLLDARD